jgi:hypothetical protein
MDHGGRQGELLHLFEPKITIDTGDKDEGGLVMSPHNPDWTTARNYIHATQRRTTARLQFISATTQSTVQLLSMNY